MGDNESQFVSYIKIVVKIVNLYEITNFFFFLTLKAHIYMYGFTSLPHEEIELANTCKLPVHLNVFS